MALSTRALRVCLLILCLPVYVAASHVLAHGNQTGRGTTSTKVRTGAGSASLSALFNNAGISDDSAAGQANFDGLGYSYSAQALQAAGISAGQPVTSNGMTFQWPGAATGTPDNVLAQGQTITFVTPAGGAMLAFLGAATHGPTVGTATITYTDGITQTFQLGFSDWTLNANGSQPSYGNSIVASMLYRNPRQSVATHVFYTDVALQAGKTVSYVTLPSTVNQGALHVFAVTVGTPGAPTVTSTVTTTGTPTATSTVTATSTPTAADTEQDLSALFNNAGISDDSSPSTASFDDAGYSYSAQALQAAGISAGQPVTSDGVTFQWPGAATGTPDNVLAQGQTITFATPANGSVLAFLGAATHGPATGTGTITYSDGMTQTYTLGFSDWTLNHGTSQPSYGNGSVASMPYRNGGTGRQLVQTYVFSAAVPLRAGKAVSKVTLPTMVNQGTLHIFAIAVGNPIQTATPTVTATATATVTPTVTATPALVTYADYASSAATTLEASWRSGNAWRMCLIAGCPVTNQDWGADSLTYDLYFRWHTTGATAIVPYLQSLINTTPNYTPCSLTCSQWSDVPMWDSIAASREYEATGGNATALLRAEHAFSAVQDASAFYATGACPDIRYQQPLGAGNHLKTLETDSNYVKAALLLYNETGNAAYLADAKTTYAAIRARFLDPQVPLYTVYVFDNGTTCTQVPHRFFASVNGNMIVNGLMLASATKDPSYQVDAIASAKAVAQLGNARGIYADLQAENDIGEPLVEAMYDVATQAGQTFARDWLLQGANAAISARTASGYGRFFDGPPPLATLTAWQTNGGFALVMAAAALDPSGQPATTGAWTNATYVAHDLSSLPATLTFTGSGIALIGTIGEHCCEGGHARVFVDGQETFDQTGIWQNKSSSGLSLPNSVLFTWRWPSSGTHTLTFQPGVANAKEGSSFLHIIGYDLLP